MRVFSLFLLFVAIFNINLIAEDCSDDCRESILTISNVDKMLPKLYTDKNEQKYWMSKIQFQKDYKALLEEMRKVDAKIESGKSILEHAGKDKSIKRKFKKLEKLKKKIDKLQKRLAKKYPEKYKDQEIVNDVRWEIFYYDYLNIQWTRIKKNIQAEDEVKYAHSQAKLHEKKKLVEGLKELEEYAERGDHAALYLAGTAYVGRKTNGGIKLSKRDRDYNKGIGYLYRAAETGHTGSMARVAWYESKWSKKGRITDSDLKGKVTPDKAMLYAVLSSRRDEKARKLILGKKEKLFKDRAKNYEIYEKEGFFQEDEFAE